mmetsp:Transcript_4241/g.11279  ORF Transcript_4241/g.11279 Transcript_4241/m.11279 type:complete len:264 (+) Transcript_4241:2037-2828(+)
MTPATMEPEWMPILNFISSVWICMICEAATKRRSNNAPWPRRSFSSSSLGRTPTAATYSSPTVSIFVTLFERQMSSICVNCSFRNRSSSLGTILRVNWSKSLIKTKRIDTRGTWSAIGAPGSVSMGPMTCTGIMYSRMLKILAEVSFCCSSCRNLMRRLFSNANFLMMAMRRVRLSRKTLHHMSRLSKTSSPDICQLAMIQPGYMRRTQNQTMCMCSSWGRTQGCTSSHVMLICMAVWPMGEQSTWRTASSMHTNSLPQNDVH